MEIHGKVNSHIQLPKSVLKAFSFLKNEINKNGLPEKHNYVYCLDMDGKISVIDIKEANTGFGYYEEKVEQILSETESAFGEVKEKINSAIKNCTGDTIKLNLPNNAEIVVKKYCSFCIVRSEEFVKAVKRKFLFIELLANTAPNTIIYAYLKNPEIIDQFISEKNISFVVSKDANFILPQCGAYSVTRGSKNFDIYIPISPKIAIMLTDSNTTDKEGRLIVGSVEGKIIDTLNNCGIRAEVTYNQRAIYAQSEDDLIKYRDVLLSLKEGN